MGSLTKVGMQMLMAAPPLRHFYLEQPPRKLGTFNTGLQEVFQGTSGAPAEAAATRAKARAGSFNPQKLLSSLGTVAKHLKGRQQQDAQDLLHILLESIESEERKPLAVRQRREQSQSQKPAGKVGKEVERSTSNSPAGFMSAMFGGQLLQRVSCTSCSHESDMLEPFIDLSLPIPAEPVEAEAETAPSATNSKGQQPGGGAQAGKAQAAQAADTGAEGAGATPEPPLTKKQQKKVDKQVSSTASDLTEAAEAEGDDSLGCIDDLFADDSAPTVTATDDDDDGQSSFEWGHANGGRVSGRVTLDTCLRAFFAVETVTWECPGEKAEGKRRRLLSQAASKHAPAKEGAGHGKDAAASPDVQTFASSPPAESNRGLHHSVSFTDAAPGLRLIPGSVEQRGTDLIKAMKGDIPFIRPLKTAGRAYVTIKARMDEHSLRRLILSAEQHDATLPTMELLPTEGKLFAVDVAKVKCYQSEAEQQRLQGQAQLLMDCAADMLTHEGLEGLRGMTASTVRVEEAPGGPYGWVACGSMPDDSGGGSWTYPSLGPPTPEPEDCSAADASPQTPKALAGPPDQEFSITQPGRGSQQSDAARTSAEAAERPDAPPAGTQQLEAASSSSSFAAAWSETAGMATSSSGEAAEAAQPESQPDSAERLVRLTSLERMDEEELEDEDFTDALSANTDPFTRQLLLSEARARAADRLKRRAARKAAAAAAAAASQEGPHGGAPDGAWEAAQPEGPLADQQRLAAAPGNWVDGHQGRCAQCAARPAAAGGDGDAQACTCRPQRPTEAAAGGAAAGGQLYAGAGRAEAARGEATGPSTPPGSVDPPAHRRSRQQPGRSALISLQRKASKGYCIHRAPPLLAVHLKRFQQDLRGRLSKIRGPVPFPFTLDISSVCDPKGPDALHQVHPMVLCRAQMLLLVKAVKDQGPTLSFELIVPNGAVQGPDAVGARYALVGVVEHQGMTLSNGHYVAFVQRGLALPACPAVAAALQQHCPPAEPAPAGSHGSSQSTTAAAEGGVSSSSQNTGAVAGKGNPSSSSQSSGAAAGRGRGTSAGASDGHPWKRSRSPAKSSSRSTSSDAAAAGGGGGLKAGLAGGKAEATSSGSGGPAAEVSQGSAYPAELEGKDAASAKPSGSASRPAKPKLVEAVMSPDDWEAKPLADSPEDDVKPALGSAEVSAAPAEEAGAAPASAENQTSSSSEGPVPSASESLSDSEPVENARQESDLHATSAPLENGQTPSPDADSHSDVEAHPLPESTAGSQNPAGLQSGSSAWYCISDTQVKSVSAAEVMACEAYLLLYTRIA
eukprot:jgi/Astpho2/3980/fgenesh1_pg.00063_%23_38_t